MKIGVIGLGIIGTRMALRWSQAGHEVMGWNRTAARAQGIGLRLAATPAGLARECDRIMIVVADPAALEAVISGPDGVAGVNLTGKVVFNASTVGGKHNQRAQTAVESAGGAFLETPFTGSKEGAEQGKLVFYAGGDAALLRREEPLLLHVGQKVIHFGRVGNAADVKLIMNMMVANLMQAMAEGFALARKAGLNMDSFLDAYRLNAGWCKLSEMKTPKILAGDYSTHFALKHMDKDLRLALERATELGLSLPQSARA